MKSRLLLWDQIMDISRSDISRSEMSSINFETGKSQWPTQCIFMFIYEKWSITGKIIKEMFYIDRCVFHESWAYIFYKLVRIYCTVCTPRQFWTVASKLSYLSHANDTQLCLYVTITKDRVRDVLVNLEKCIAEIKI